MRLEVNFRLHICVYKHTYIANVVFGLHMHMSTHTCKHIDTIHTYTKDLPSLSLSLTHTHNTHTKHLTHMQSYPASLCLKPKEIKLILFITPLHVSCSPISFWYKNHYLQVPVDQDRNLSVTHNVHHSQVLRTSCLFSCLPVSFQNQITAASILA